MTRKVAFCAVLTLLLALSGTALGQDIPEGGWAGNVTIGNADVGNATGDEGTFTVTGNGTDIQGTADHCQFLYKELVGDGAMSCRVVDVGTGSNAWCKGGIMVRQTTEAGSMGALMPITGGNGNGSSWQWRLDNDGGTNYTNSGPVVAPPYFVKIERVGDTFSGLYSPDGITWTQLGESQTIVMGETALIGLAVTSHAGGELRTYTFDTLGFSGGVSGLADPGTASNPSPEDEDSDVIRDTLLTWTPGQYPGTHDVYFGSSFEDVNSATVPAAAGLDVNSFAPGRLEFGQTYYWRADEVNGTPDKTVFKGEVWSFTAEPYSILIPGAEVAVTASSSANEFSLPEKLTDGSGMGEDGTHAIVPESMWFTAAVDLDPWVQFDFDGIKQLDIMKIWNSNGAAESAIGWGVKDVVIEYSVDGENWTVLPDANQISRAPGLTTYAQADEIAFSGVPAKMVRLDIGSNWGGILMSYGLSEVQFTMIPAAGRTPEPASGATGVQPGDTVTWRAGREVDTHTLYIGTDANAVANGTAPSVTTSTTSLDLGTLGLELGDTYYWRVDEVNEAEETIVWAGPVWNLSIVPAVVVDDFEGYGNLSPDRPFQTWLDGFGYSVDEFFPVPYGGNGTGSGIGHDVWTLTSPHYDGDIMETVTVINGSTQSMPLYFDGSSQTDRAFTPAQDWTLGGVTTLSIAVKGNAGLSAANTLYAKINGTRVQYGGDLTVPIWKPWHVDLTTLGINLNSVTTLSIGVEGSGSGVVLLDDILLHKTAPVINEPPAGSDMSLVAHWKLDETEGLDVADSSGYGNNGVLIGMDGSEWTTGHNGGALAFSGVSGNAASGNYVRFENATNLQLTDSATISAWVKLNEGNDGVYMGIAGKLISGQYKGFALVRHSSNVFRLWCNDAGFNLAGAEASSDATYTDTEWHHLAGVVDDGTSTLYVDGVRQIQEGAVDLIDSGTYAHIGKQYSDDSSHRYWNGLVDEVRIYYRALSEQEVQGL